MYVCVCVYAHRANFGLAMMKCRRKKDKNGYAATLVPYEYAFRARLAPLNLPVEPLREKMCGICNHTRIQDQSLFINYCRNTVSRVGFTTMPVMIVLHVNTVISRVLG